MAPQYVFEISCVDAGMANVDALHTMTDNAREVTLDTIRQHCAGLAEWEKSMGYDTGNERGGLRLKNDWHVTFHKSVYRKRRCYYIRHSAIEYIWTRRN
jgi:hypothetical protein